MNSMPDLARPRGGFREPLPYVLSMVEAEGRADRMGARFRTSAVARPAIRTRGGVWNE